ncbi:LysR family transcriptional regulator [Klebsiella pneumoniae]|uniref:LysR family transcriptional regulator n=1 Tax=Klebsiella pneumoniae TaxID=573 RepID=UPI003B427C70
MHVSPSTLSRQIQRLEEDLGQPLFVRDNRTVTLPKPGKSYVPLPSKLYCSTSSFVTSSISRPFALRRAAYLLLCHRRL